MNRLDACRDEEAGAIAAAAGQDGSATQHQCEKPDTLKRHG